MTDGVDGQETAHLAVKSTAPRVESLRPLTDFGLEVNEVAQAAGTPPPNSTASNKAPLEEYPVQPSVTVPTPSKPRLSPTAIVVQVWDRMKEGPVFILAPILTWFSLWVVSLFPWLRPWEPPPERAVSISNISVAERNFENSELGEVTVVLFETETIGYDADEIEVRTLWLYEGTGERVEEELERWGRLASNTRVNRWVQWIDVPNPDLPFDLKKGRSRCLILRVLLFVEPPLSIVERVRLFLSPEKNSGTREIERITEPTSTLQLLAFADTKPFDPFTLDVGECAYLKEPAADVNPIEALGESS